MPDTGGSAVPTGANMNTAVKIGEPLPADTIVPLRTAEVVVMLVAESVVTTGRITTHAGVAKESVAPLAEPPELVAVALKA